MGSAPRMSRATSPSAIPFTSSGCRPQKSATCSKVSEVLSTSQTAVALGIRISAISALRKRRRPAFRPGGVVIRHIGPFRAQENDNPRAGSAGNQTARRRFNRASPQHIPQEEPMPRQEFWNRHRGRERSWDVRDLREDYGQADYSRDYGFDRRRRVGYRTEARGAGRDDFGQADFSRDYDYDPKSRTAVRRGEMDERNWRSENAAELDREHRYEPRRERRLD